MTELGQAEIRPGTSPALEFLRVRWKGETTMGRLLWRDMLLVGSVLNVLASFAALYLVSQHAPRSLALLVHFAVLPYNIFLALSLWQTALRNGDSTVAYLLVAIVWMAAVSMI